MPTSSAISLRLVPAYPCSREAAPRDLEDHVPWSSRIGRGVIRWEGHVGARLGPTAVTRSVYRLVGSSVPRCSRTFSPPSSPAFVVTADSRSSVTTVYLHRALSHRALTLHPAAALPFRFVIWITTGMRPREWVAVHRKHHAATDTAEDPHSPSGRRVLAGAARQRRPLQAGRDRPGEHAQVRARHPRRSRSTGSRSTTRSSGSAIGIAILVVGMSALGFPLLGRVPRRRDPRGHAT